MQLKSLNKKNAMLLGMLFFLILIVLIGLTYSWFSAIVKGNNEAKTDVVETGTLSIVYTNSSELRGEQIKPGWSETIDFTVENTGTAASYYKINWENLTNEFVNKNDLVYSLTSDNGRNLSETVLPESGEHLNIIESVEIGVGEVHTYTLTVKYLNKDYDQNSDQGKNLIGKIEVVDVNGTSSGAKDIINKYSENNTEGLIKIDHPGGENENAIANAAYRYSGSNEEVKNYIKFNNETWRIIGIFETQNAKGKVEPRMKIIREESIGNYSWDSSANGVNSGWGVNQWGESGSYEGADIMRLLNPGFTGVNGSLYYDGKSGSCYNSSNNITASCDFTTTGLKEESKKMIEEMKWFTAASDYNQTVENSYMEERSKTVGTADSGTSVTKTYEWNGLVGLMDPSDYGYASKNCYSSTLTGSGGYDRITCTNSNWLFNSINQWTFSPNRGFYNYVRLVSSSGLISHGIAYGAYGIRPSLYLKSNIKITSGDGTKENMYEISL